jgi:hypothetical protein
MSTLGPQRGLYTPRDLAAPSAKLDEGASPDEPADQRELRAAALLLLWNSGTPEPNDSGPDATAGIERLGAGTLLMAFAALASAPKGGNVAQWLASLHLRRRHGSSGSNTDVTT